nr:26S proteasome non-ATPase regulatory subunit 10 [Arenicola marina]
MAAAAKVVCDFAYNGDLNQLKLKVNENAQLASACDQSGRSPIHWAASRGHAAVVDFLLTQHSVNVDQRDESNWTPLLISVSAGKEDIVRNLINRGAQINAVNSTGQCALHYAASKDRYQIAELLLERGADAIVADCVSTTPLHRAAAKGNVKMTKLLLSYNADPNYQDVEGNTPLHVACEDSELEVAKLLVESGGSLTQRNKDEKSPMDMASPTDRRQLQRLQGTGEIMSS